MTQEQAPTVSVLIVNYNGREWIGACLDSVARFMDVGHEVIVVDNASTDGSREYLRDHYPHVALIASPHNLGFGAGCNLAARAARGRHLLLLNPDARLGSGVSAGIQALEADPSIAVLGGRVSFPSGRLQPSIGHEHDPLRVWLSWMPLLSRAGRVFPGLTRTEARGDHYQHLQVGLPWVSFSFALVPKEAWLQLGGMDEQYFLYVEDVDFCRRVREAGRQVAFTPRMQAIHMVRGGSPRMSPVALLHNMRSAVLFAHKFSGADRAQLLRAGLVLAMLLKGTRSALPGVFRKQDRRAASAYLQAASFLLRQRHPTSLARPATDLGGER